MSVDNTRLKKIENQWRAVSQGNELVSVTRSLSRLETFHSSASLQLNHILYYLGPKVNPLGGTAKLGGDKVTKSVDTERS